MKNAEIRNKVIFNPIMRDAFQYDWSPPDPPVLTYAGRLDHYKHPELLIEIAYMLNKLYNLNVKVKIIGKQNKSVVQKIVNYSKRYKQDVTLLGFLERSKYLEELSKSSALIIPSEGEAYNIVVGEALATGTPVIIPREWGRTWKNVPGVCLTSRWNAIKEYAKCFYTLYIAKSHDPKATKEYLRSKYHEDKILGENLKLYFDILSQ